MGNSIFSVEKIIGKLREILSNIFSVLFKMPIYMNLECFKKNRNKIKKNNQKLGNNSYSILKRGRKTDVSEAKIKSTLDSTFNGVLVFNRNKEIAYKNKMAEDFFKNSEKSYTNDYIKERIKNYSEVEDCIDYVFDNLCEKYSFIYTVNSIIYQAIFAPLMIKGKLEGVLCILIDKTEIKKAQEKIKNINQRYNRFLESIEDGIIVMEGDKKIYVNEACKGMFKGYIDKIDFNIDTDEEKKESMYIIDNKKIYVEMNFSRYRIEDKNKTIIVIKDITHSKIAQIKLRESQNSYGRFIDILPDGICLFDKNLDVYYANESLLEILDIGNVDEIIGENLKNVIILDVKQRIEFEIKMRRVLEDNKRMFIIEHEIITKCKKRIHVEINTLPFVMGEKKYIMCIVKDLTNKKSSETAEKELIKILKTDKIKTEFFANMSHELKTPLNVISSCNQLLESFYKAGKINDYNGNIESHIELVKQNSYRLQRLINNIIDFTKMESGVYNLKLEKYNIVQVIEDLFMEVEHYAIRKKINLVFDTNSEEINMYIDKFNIERAILNLISNCIKFTPNGGDIYLNINYALSSVIISIKDTGIGIPKDKLNLVFKEFTQVDKTLSRGAEGSGIGLAIVKNIIELHNGSIEVISEEHRGTEILIKLPIKKNDYRSKEKDRSIYNINEQIKIEFSDIYY